MPKFPYDPANHCIYLLEGKFDGSNTLPHIADSYLESDDSTMVVHFHGGLVDRKSGQKAAENLFNQSYGHVAYPVFFIWESGIQETVRVALPRIVRNALFKVLLEQISRFAVGKIEQGARAAVAAGGGVRGSGGPLTPKDLLTVRDELRSAQAEGKPAFEDKDPHAVTQQEELTQDEEDLFIRELQNDTRFVKEAEAVTGSLAAQGVIVGPAADSLTRGPTAVVSSTSDTHALLAPEVMTTLHTDLKAKGADDADTQARAGILGTISIAIAKKAALALKNVIVRFATQRDHGVQATIIEEILRVMFLGDAGREVWSTMKQFTAQAFGDDSTERGGTEFLKMLQQLKEKGKFPSRIVLTGHSTGAVYICYLLKAAHQMLPDLKFEVIFLAPACDFTLLAQTLKKYGDQISHLRIFGMQDTVEREDFVLQIDELKNFPALQKLYPGSLLYLVSGVLESESDHPLAGMARFYSGQSPYDEAAFPEIEATRDFLDKAPHGFVWSIASDGSGLDSTSRHHGDFDDDPITLGSLNYLLKSGF